MDFWSYARFYSLNISNNKIFKCAGVHCQFLIYVPWGLWKWIPEGFVCLSCGIFLELREPGNPHRQTHAA